MPVLVQNLQAGPSVFSDPKDDVQVEWGPKGDPSGDDVQYVPDALISNVAFMRAIQRGIFKVVDTDESTQDALARQMSSYQERTSAAQAAAASSLDQQANNDLVEKPCIGPSARGNGECGNPVPVREKSQNDAPVLCSQHQSLRTEFAQIETSEMIETGDSLVPAKRWVRTQIDPRERAASTAQ